MTPQPPTEVIRLHPREHEEYFYDPLAERLLPPSPLHPFCEDGSVSPEAFSLVELATKNALEVSRTAETLIPDDMIAEAVGSNFAERFQRTREALEDYYGVMEAGAQWRRLFEMHEHSHPTLATKFFHRLPELPALDLGAALCSHDTYSIAKEIVGPRELGRNLNLHIVDDDLPHLKVSLFHSSENDKDYAIIMSKKIIAEDDDPTKQIKMKRRKTYVADIETLQALGFAVAQDGKIEVATEKLAVLLQAAEITPSYLHPVIESVFIERKGVFRGRKESDVAARLNALDDEE
jgi:hypothetical protein